MNGRVAKVVDWLDERAGVRGIWRWLADEPVRGGARWAYVLGSGLLAVFALQAVTGILLATYYSPSSTDAWASVYYIQREVSLGWFIRGLHHYGASAMIVLAVAHATQTFLFGAFRKPRELNWVIGVLMALLILAFGLTGYLLPWDQKGYWATRVASGIAGSMPLVGGIVERTMIGGGDYGNITLTRFYALHVLVLPALLVGLLGVHLFLFRRHGATPPPWAGEKKLAFVEKFWPHQVARDAWFALAVLLVMSGLTVWSHGAHLDAPADPGSDYLARPDWYFLFLFQLLKYFEGPLQLVGTVVLPGVATAICLFLPALDRSPSRLPGHSLWRVGIAFLTPGILFMTLHLAGLGSPGERSIGLVLGFVVTPLLVVFGALAAILTRRPDPDAKPATGTRTRWTSLVVFAGLGGVVALTGIALVEDLGNPAVARAERGAEERARRAIELAAGGIPPGGGSALWETDPLYRGGRVFAEHCIGCHVLGGSGGDKGPQLTGYARRAWLVEVIRNPHDPRLFGPTKMRLMPEYTEPGEAEAYAELLLAESGAAVDEALVAQGRALFFEKKECLDCHLYAGKGRAYGTPGPELEGYATAAWLEAFVRDPSAPQFFGRINEMPVFADKLTDQEIADVVLYVLARRGEEMEPAPVVGPVAEGAAATEAGTATETVTATAAAAEP